MRSPTETDALPVDSKEQVGLRIRTLRKQAKLTQDQIAEKVGIDAKSLSRIEQGKHYPSLDTLEAIGRAIGVPLREFFEFSDAVEPIKLARDRLKLLAETLPDERVRELLRIASNLN